MRGAESTRRGRVWRWAIACAALCLSVSTQAAGAVPRPLVLASDFDGAMTAAKGAIRARARTDGLAIRADHVMRERWVLAAVAGYVDARDLSAPMWLGVGLRGANEALGLTGGLTLQAGSFGGRRNMEDGSPPDPDAPQGLSTDVLGLRLVATARWLLRHGQLGVDLGVRTPGGSTSTPGLHGAVHATLVRPLGPALLLLRGAACWASVSAAAPDAPPYGGALGVGASLGGFGLLLEARAGMLEPTISVRGARAMLTLVWQR